VGIGLERTQLVGETGFCASRPTSYGYMTRDEIKRHDAEIKRQKMQRLKVDGVFTRPKIVCLARTTGVVR